MTESNESDGSIWSTSPDDDSDDETSKCDNSSFFQSKKFWQGDNDSSSSSTASSDVDVKENLTDQCETTTSCQEHEEITCTMQQLHLIKEDANLVNLDNYFCLIEKALLKKGQVLSMRVTEQHRKTMLKTLLGLDRVEFDGKMHESKQLLQHRRILSFLRNEFQPCLIDKEHEELVNQDRLHQIKKGLSQAMKISSPTYNKKVDTITAPMAEGPVYKGSFVALLQDVAPELVSSYVEAKDGLTLKDVMMHMVKDMEQPVEERRDAVEQCIHCQLPPFTSLPHSKDYKHKGLDCEQQCIKFLRDGNKSSPNTIVVQNVTVKTVKSSRRNKNDSKQTTLSFVTFDDANNDDSGENVTVQSGVIETTVSMEDGTCGEFDALVIEKKCGDNCCCIVRQVWEAKASINPVTIRDAMYKKLPALEELIHVNGNATLCLSNGQVLTIEPSAPFLFGLYGSWLQPPQKAANQAAVVACNRALATSADSVVQAIDSGHVEIDCKPVMESVALLEEQLAEKKYVVVVVENNTMTKDQGGTACK